MYKVLREWIKDNAYKAINVKLKDIGIMYDIHNKGKFNPTVANDNAVKELRGQVESMQSQMNEMLSLLKHRNPNPV